MHDAPAVPPAPPSAVPPAPPSAVPPAPPSAAPPVTPPSARPAARPAPRRAHRPTPLLVAALFVLLAALSATPPATAAPAVQVTVTVTPESSLPGTNGSVEVELENTGTTEVGSSLVRLEEVGAGLVVGEESWTTSRLAPGQVTTIQFGFQVRENASAGYHPLPLGIRYCDASACADVDQTVLVTVRTLDALVLEEVRPARLEPGRATNATFLLHNGARAPLENVVVTWSAQQDAVLPLGAGNTFVVPEVAGGETVPVGVRVTTPADLAAGLYAITLTARYTDGSGQALNSTMVAGIRVGGPAEFGISLQEWDGDSLSLSVSNVGVSPARAVEVRVLSGPVDAAPTPVLLGTLDPGDFTTAEFTAARAAGEEGPLRVEVAYTDTDGERRTGQSQVAVGNQGIPEQEEGSAVPWVVAAVVLVLAGVGVWLYRRRKRAA